MLSRLPAAGRQARPVRLILLHHVMDSLIDSFFPALPSFLVLGIGSEVVAAAGLFTLFRRRGWF